MAGRGRGTEGRSITASARLDRDKRRCAAQSNNGISRAESAGGNGGGSGDNSDESEEEVILSSEDGAKETVVGPQACKGRKAYEDVLRPDLLSLNEEEKATTLKRFHQAKNQESARRSRAATKRRQKVMAEEEYGLPELRTIAQVATTPGGGYRARISLNLRHPTKSFLMHDFAGGSRKSEHYDCISDK